MLLGLKGGVMDMCNYKALSQYAIVCRSIVVVKYYHVSERI